MSPAARLRPMSPPLWKAVRALGVVAYAGAVAAVFLLTAYVSFNFFVHSGATGAPDLTGLARDEAARLISDHGLALKVAEGAARYDAEVPAGHVIAQHPAAGTLVKRGSTVQVTLSLGPQQLAVPDLAGRSVQSAQVSLAAAGLAMGRVLSIFSAGAEAGTVVEQAPAAGSAVAPTTAVDILVAHSGSVSAYVMPDLVYRDYDVVRLFFESRGFRFGSVKYEPYEGVAEGVILRQFPLAGHPIARTDAISVVVATTAEAAATGQPG